jgi:hypothetical protein
LFSLVVNITNRRTLVNSFCYLFSIYAEAGKASEIGNIIVIIQEKTIDKREEIGYIVNKGIEAKKTKKTIDKLYGMYYIL